MKCTIATIIFLILLSPVYAQEPAKQTTPCKCEKTFHISYPNVAEEDELEGTVIVEFEIDSTCSQRNPIVIQSLGDLYDKEALRVVNLIIAYNNSCALKCKYSACEKKKMKFPIKFKKSD